MDSEILEKTWADHYVLPPPGNMMEMHDKRNQVFINQGTAIARAIVSTLEKYAPGKSIRDLNVLDFGCGVGRAVLPLYHYFQKPDHCVDVDPSVIAYLQGQVPGANPARSAFSPPLPFGAESFDLIYAVSVWTHLDAQTADAWLWEMKRILRPGGLAFLTTSNYAVLDYRRKHSILGNMGWAKVLDADLREQGVIFKVAPSTPGTGTYGMSSHDPDWLRREWSKYMPVAGIESGALFNIQDINVLRK